MFSVYTNFFVRLDEAHIPYCHWKSNEHLRAGLNGDTDLDVIVDREHRQEVEQGLHSAGFKRFRTAPFHSHPATEDYLGFDEETGELVHIHLHYRLILGGELKQYHVPWADRILETRKRDEETGVYVCDPNVEMVLLLIRYALKLERRDYMREFVGGSYPGRDIRREYDWLQERTDDQQVKRHATDLIGSESVEFVEALLDGLTIWKFRALREVVIAEFQIYRSFSRTGSWVQRRRRRFLKKFRWYYRDFARPNLFRRTIPSGGLIVAFVGPDGSGKSTTSSAISDWLSWKLDVYQLYMGSNDIYSIPKRLLNLGWNIYTGLFGDPAASNNASSEADSESGDTSSENDTTESGSSILGRCWDAAYALVVSYEKRKKLKRVWRARNKGAVVITDRFPQNEIMGINDGPLLHEWDDHPSKFRRWLSTCERRPYEWAQRNPPDVVVKLNVDPETSFERDPDANPEVIREKCEILQSLSFGGAKVIEIDANQPKVDVIENAKDSVWSEL